MGDPIILIINTTAFKCYNIILSQDRIPLLGGVGGGFLLETQIIKITNNAHQVNNNAIIPVLKSKK